jgi:hypothetical protein
MPRPCLIVLKVSSKLPQTVYRELITGDELNEVQDPLRLILRRTVPNTVSIPRDEFSRGQDLWLLLLILRRNVPNTMSIWLPLVILCRDVPKTMFTRLALMILRRNVPNTSSM